MAERAGGLVSDGAPASDQRKSLKGEVGNDTSGSLSRAAIPGTSMPGEVTGEDGRGLGGLGLCPPVTPPICGAAWALQHSSSV